MYFRSAVLAVIKTIFFEIWNLAQTLHGTNFLKKFFLPLKILNVSCVKKSFQQNRNKFIPMLPWFLWIYTLNPFFAPNPSVTPSLLYFCICVLTYMYSSKHLYWYSHVICNCLLTSLHGNCKFVLREGLKKKPGKSSTFCG